MNTPVEAEVSAATIPASDGDADLSEEAISDGGDVEGANAGGVIASLLGNSDLQTATTAQNVEGLIASVLGMGARPEPSSTADGGSDPVDAAPATETIQPPSNNAGTETGQTQQSPTTESVEDEAAAGTRQSPNDNTPTTYDLTYRSSTAVQTGDESTATTEIQTGHVVANLNFGSDANEPVHVTGASITHDVAPVKGTPGAYVVDGSHTFKAEGPAVEIDGLVFSADSEDVYVNAVATSSADVSESEGAISSDEAVSEASTGASGVGGGSGTTSPGVAVQTANAATRFLGNSVAAVSACLGLSTLIILSL